MPPIHLSSSKMWWKQTWSAQSISGGAKHGGFVWQMLVRWHM